MSGRRGVLQRAYDAVVEVWDEPFGPFAVAIGVVVFVGMLSLIVEGCTGR